MRVHRCVDMCLVSVCICHGSYMAVRGQIWVMIPSLSHSVLKNLTQVIRLAQ